jgi:hypothetical protein
MIYNAITLAGAAEDNPDAALAVGVACVGIVVLVLVAVYRVVRRRK